MTQSHFVAKVEVIGEPNHPYNHTIKVAKFAQLSNKNPNKKKSSFKQIRPGHLNDLIKTNPWRTLNNY